MDELGKSFAEILVLLQVIFCFCGEETFSAFLEMIKKWKLLDFLLTKCHTSAA